MVDCWCSIQYIGNEKKKYTKKKTHSHSYKYLQIHTTCSYLKCENIFIFILQFSQWFLLHIFSVSFFKLNWVKLRYVALFKVEINFSSCVVIITWLTFNVLMVRRRQLNVFGWNIQSYKQNYLFHVYTYICTYIHLFVYLFICLCCLGGGIVIVLKISCEKLFLGMFELLGDITHRYYIMLNQNVFSHKVVN